MNVVKATRQFETWLAQRTRIDQKDLRLKHSNMKKDVFMFLRATYYRWAQIWPQVCPDACQAPKVLAVGDLHVENFGTWRDIEGRLIWGVNDFDEAWPMAYTIDLVRLAVSAHLAAEAGHLPVKREDICTTLLDGYRESMLQKGSPFVLGESHQWLRHIAEGELRDPVHFWDKMDALPTLKTECPISAIDAIEHLMPARSIPYRLTHRTAGLGSLGHARYVAIADWHGGRIAREAKALVPSSSHWAQSIEADKNCGPAEILYQTIINRAVRCPDPFVQLRGRWIVRRLGPRLLPHRASLPARPRHRTSPPPRHGMGNRQHPPRHSLRPQVNPPPHRQTKIQVAAPRRRSHAPSHHRRLASLEEKRLRLIQSSAGVRPAVEGVRS